MKKQICVAIVLSMLLCLLPSAVSAVYLQTYCEGHLDLPDGYTYLQIPFTAPGDGVLAVSITNLAPGVEVGFGLSGNPEYSQYDSGETYLTFEVISGATYVLEFWGYDFAAGYHTASTFDYQITYSGDGTIVPYEVPQRGETPGMPISLNSGTSEFSIPSGKVCYFSYLPVASSREQQLIVSGLSGFEVIIDQWDHALGQYVQSIYFDTEGTVNVLLSDVTGAFSFSILNLQNKDVTYSISLGEVVKEEGNGSSENPFVIDTFPYEITVDAGRYDLYYTFTPERDGVITISYPNGNFVTGLQNFHKDDDAQIYRVNVYAGVPVTFCPCGDYAGSFVISWVEEPNQNENLNDAFLGGGTLEDPYLIDSIPVDLEFTIPEGENDVFFQYIAQEDGVIQLLDCSCISMVILNGEWVNSPSVSVTAGTAVLFNFYSEEPGNQKASIAYAEPQPEKLPLSGTIAFNVDHLGVPAVIYVDVTAEGTLTVQISGDPGYIFTVTKPDGTLLDVLQLGVLDGVYTYQVNERGTYQVEIMAYDAESFAIAEGTVTYDISFVEDQKQPDKPAYVVSDVVIHEPGSYDISMLYAHVTLFSFYPMESGVYKITVGSNVLIGYYGADADALFGVDSVEHAVTLQWICTEDPEIILETLYDDKGEAFEIAKIQSGQQAFIGIISDSASVLVTIEKVALYTPVPEDTLEWTEYIPDENPVPIVPVEENGYVSIGVADDISTILVLGEDGVYHYGTSDGPIVVIDLSIRDGFPFDFASIVQQETLGFYLYLNESLVAKYDCGAFLVELQDMGPVALTEEILNMVVNVGNSARWWDTVDEGIYADHPNAWMRLCSYVEGTENDATGDGISVVIALLAASGMGIFVLKRRQL